VFSGTVDIDEVVDAERRRIRKVRMARAEPVPEASGNVRE